MRGLSDPEVQEDVQAGIVFLGKSPLVCTVVVQNNVVAGRDREAGIKTEPRRRRTARGPFLDGPVAHRTTF